MNVKLIGSILFIVLLCMGIVSCLHQSMRDDAISDGGLFYVSMDGKDTNPGSLSQPFRSIQKAASVMTAGDTVYVREGIYEEMVTPRRSGTSDQWISYLTFPGETVVVTVDAVNADACFSVKEREYLLFDGFTVRGGRVAGGLVQGPTSAICFENMTIEGNNHGLYFLEVNHLLM